ncbi:zinc-binding dehydrogenase [Microbacterium sp. SSW1-59]|uniref:zinc-binding dehydrogenase n=1 Tax=Microbacterium xanthum TaxID=3079794 RepID=UPI002AD5A3D4|nr:zinc-binding dehydrogenase [Microbacterium sp. SSW1-59]MDZ8202569.1 zinc-binding dehydrogenase [Microbacterium sp. SSW1-59]
MNDTPTMIAARIHAHGGPDVLTLDRVTVPEPGPGQIRVRVVAAALNNTDLWTREGAYGVDGENGTPSGWTGRIDFPRVPGGDVAGFVDAVGDSVDASMTGARVVLDPATYDAPGDDALPVRILGSEYDGGYAPFVVVPATHAHRVDDSPLDDAQLAALPIAYGTAMGMIERAGLGRGDLAVVTGASGGVGLALVQLAVARGAEVITVCSRAKAADVRAAGASHVVDRSSDAWSEVGRIAPDGVTAVLDVVAGSNIRSGLPHLRTGARWVVAGALGGHEIDIDVRTLYLGNISLIGSTMHTRAHFRALMDLARRGAVRPLIAQTFALSEVHRAQEELASRRHVGKLVLLPEHGA